jgi:hypothetical protein
MVQLALELHPGSTCDAVDAIEVVAAREGELLRLRFVVTGRIEGVRVPPPADAERTDGLWHHTCLEAFVRAPGDDGYVELNLAPSTRWAAYRFCAYREGMRELVIAAPRIEVDRTPGALAVRAGVRLPLAPPWRLAPAAVIEEDTGRRSWWAARHPAGAPDFHHPDSFVHEIP